MEKMRAWINEVDPEDKKDILENIIGWGSLVAILFMLSGICV